MKKLLALSLSVFVALSCGSVWAKTTTEDATEAVGKSLQKILPALKVRSVRETPIKGLYEVYTLNGEIIYSTKSAEYILQGPLFRAEGDRFVNLSDEVKSTGRLEILSEMSASDFVIFPAEGEIKETLTVFTDSSCGYCQKFHNEVPAIQKMGVTVRYVAWPRAGANSAAGKALKNVWCAKNRQDAMTKVQNRQSVPPSSKKCDGKITEQVAIGRRMGITGTPAIFSEKGAQIGGYLSATELAKRLSL